MAIAERIRFFRTKCGMTLKYFGMALGFPEKSSDIRIVQYENGSREPKADLTADMAKVLGVSPRALKVPDIDTDLGLMHTLFTLEDTRGFKISELDGETCLRIGKPTDAASTALFDMFEEWKAEAQKLERGEITKDEYDHWRYTYPQVEIERGEERRAAARAKHAND